MLVSSHIGRLARMAARSRYALLLCLGLTIVSACKLDAKPPKGGGLVVAIDTDMSMPKDIDEVRLQVTQGATMLFQHSQQLDENAAALPLEIQVPDANDSAPVLVRALGVKDGEVRVERSAITTVPTAYLGYLRLILNYLCDGMVDQSGESSCGATMTCIQGTCEPAAIATSLPDFYQREGAMQSASTACFDVAKCFSMATEMTPELVDACSFDSNKLFPTDINVALRLEPGSAGVCTKTACWIVLDSDGDGFRVGNDERVMLPESICAQRSQGANLRVAMSMQCPSKKQSMPLCRDGSSAPIGDPENPVTVGMNMSPVSDACTGGGQRACEMCGTQARMCQNGLWSALGMCADQGVCIPEMIESCGVNGIRTCGGDCTWGDCENQTCDGPATRSCGNCGTQHRSCNNGAWSEWSACGEEGVCMPGTSQACGSGGNQACMGNCDWGDCTMQVCEGPASEPCGNCGTRERACDPNTAVWADWGECQGEGECRPDSTQPCGRDGEQTCGGNCAWDVTCAGQTCEGPARRACGLCGTQTRTCDMMTGEYSDWSACFGEGECMPDTISTCGNGGERVCGGMCRWGSTCTGQTCTGASSERCGDCGTRSRSCDTNTGAWSGWSECRAEGDCTPGETRTCGSGGTQSCSSTCRWSDACPGQMCDGPISRECANNECVDQVRMCNANMGTWGGWNPSTCMAGCTPGELIAGNCGPNAGRICDDNCSSTMSACTCRENFTDCRAASGTNPVCVDVQTDEGYCGSCTTRCPDGQTCRAGVCECPEGQARCGGPTSACVPLDTSTNCGECGTECVNGQGCEAGNCACRTTEGIPQLFCPVGNGMQCVNSLTDATNCGACGNRCMGGRICVRSAAGVTPPASCQCRAGQDTCGGTTCLDLATDEDHCGSCTIACGEGEVCVDGVCDVQCELPLVECSDQCVNTQTSITHCGRCGNSCMNGMACVNGSCACAPGYGPCGPNNSCIQLNTITNCGECGNACTGGAMCTGGDCVCNDNRTDCDGDCVNIANDRLNCGGCGRACGTGVACTAGVCDCPEGQARCDGPTSMCVPLNTGADCGRCNNQCGPGTMCMGGMCQTQCTGQTPNMCGTTCVNTQTDENNCGGCGMPCPDGATCEAGDCRCPSGSMQCGGENSACTPLNTNQNCGTCTTMCGSGTTCMGGMCRPVCTAPMDDMCGGTCTDTQTDEANCGTCGMRCPSGVMCVAGVCGCPDGQGRCGGPTSACIPLNTDQRCGTCTNVCGDGASCMGGMCRPDCALPNMMCGTMCVDTRSNDDFCGNCTTACDADEECTAGRCECTGSARRCGDGSCEVRSVDSCGPSCAPCRDMANGVAVSCSASDECQYRCDGPECDGICCATGQVCQANRCQDDTPPPPPPSGGTGGSNFRRSRAPQSD